MQEKHYCETEKKKYYIGDKNISSTELEVITVTNSMVTSTAVALSELQILLLSQMRGEAESLGQEKGKL